MANPILCPGQPYGMTSMLAVSIMIHKGNAQQMLPKGARLHVGNLQCGVPSTVLEDELEQLFAQFGICWAQVRKGRNNLCSGWVQFEHPAHAQAALQYGRFVNRGRTLRVECANGIRSHESTNGIATDFAPTPVAPPMWHGPMMPVHHMSMPHSPVYGPLSYTHYPPHPQPEYSYYHTIEPTTTAPPPPLPSSTTVSSTDATIENPLSEASFDTTTATTTDEAEESKDTTPKETETQPPATRQLRHIPLTTTNRTICEYVTEQIQRLGMDLDDESTEEVIMELEVSEYLKGRLPRLASGSGSGSGSV